MTTSLLIVDDDEMFQSLLGFVLQKAGHRVALAASAGQMQSLLDAERFDLVLLDLGLPDQDGLAVLRQLRAASRIPVIVVTGTTDRELLLAALELGADDYLNKPFDPREVLLRINAVLTRAGGTQAPELSPVASLVRFGGWRLDLRARTLRNPSDVETPLTPSEYKVLAALLRRPGWALSRDQLLDAITPGDDAPSARAIDVLVSQLRSKLEADRSRPTLILSVRGHGYRFGGTIE
jgi:two-component system, OmpR family, response regulator